MTSYQLFVDDWKDCQRCVLSEGRLHVVLARGKIPCDLVFIGEAPGESENVLGRPFVGPAGKLLDRIIERSVPEEVSYALTNLVCCIPRDEDGSKTSVPPDEAIEACASRLKQFVRLANPRLIIAVGQLPKDWLEEDQKYSITFHKKIPRVNIIHPAAILRANIAQQGLMIQRCIVNVSTGITRYLNA